MEDMARLALVEQCIRDTEVFSKVLFDLLRFITNILENPHDYALRTIKSSLLKAYCGLDAFDEYLKYIGFVTVDNQMMYPKEQKLSNLQIAKAAIERKISYCCGNLALRQLSQKPKPNQMKKPKLIPMNVLRTKNPLLLKIESLFNNMIKYEDEQLQQLAREQVPVVTLQLMALDRLREHQQRIKTGEIKTEDLSFDIAMLMELIGWFKHKFFKWVDKPECRQCGGPTKFVGNSNMRTPTETCLVELYQCTQCPNGRSEFPRFNDASMLLRTRRGRCGEWANCFTLLLRAMGYDTRYVYDTTDHVWCEVYDYDSKTWLHVDPCEGKLNAPLLYSHGWGKKLSYVIAVSKDDLQDVTWRYTTNHKEVLIRRNLCSESQLVSGILLLREARQRQFSAPRRSFLATRTLAELVQLLVERKPEDFECHGRISGARAWRAGRGEAGAAAGHEFRFSQPGEVSVRYNCVTDEYQVSGSGALKSWSAGAFAARNVQRKLETDWRMVYLAREEGSSHGFVSWRLASAGAVSFTSLCVRASHQAFHSADVRWTVRFDDADARPAEFSESPMRFERRFRTVEISAALMGGVGDCAWQHAQLFRTSAPNAPSAASPAPSAASPAPTTPKAPPPPAFEILATLAPLDYKPVYTASQLTK